MIQVEENDITCFTTKVTCCLDFTIVQELTHVNQSIIIIIVVMLTT